MVDLLKQIDDAKGKILKEGMDEMLLVVKALTAMDLESVQLLASLEMEGFETLIKGFSSLAKDMIKLRTAAFECTGQTLTGLATLLKKHVKEGS